MKNQNRLDRNLNKDRIYYLACCVAVGIIAFLFAFPLYWIITGAFKTGKEINSTTPVWFPSEWDLGNFQRLMTKRTAPLFDITLGGNSIRAFGYTISFDEYVITGPTVPAAIRWLLNTVFMSVGAMLITCLTAAMAGYETRYAYKGILECLCHKYCSPRAMG